MEKKISINKDNDLLFRAGLSDQKTKKIDSSNGTDDESITESGNPNEKIEYITE